MVFSEIALKWLCKCTFKCEEGNVRFTLLCRFSNCGTVQCRTAKVGSAWISKCTPVDLQRYFLKLCLIKYELYNIHVLVYLNCSFVVSLQKRLLHFWLTRNNGEINKNKQQNTLFKPTSSSIYFLLE